MKVYESVNLPSSELVLAILNGEDGVTESVINHYKGYVGTASMLTISGNGTYDIVAL